MIITFISERERAKWRERAGESARNGDAEEDGWGRGGGRAEIRVRDV